MRELCRSPQEGLKSLSGLGLAGPDTPVSGENLRGWQLQEREAGGEFCNSEGPDPPVLYVQKGRAERSCCFLGLRLDRCPAAIVAAEIHHGQGFGPTDHLGTRHSTPRANHTCCRAFGHRITPHCVRIIIAPSIIVYRSSIGPVGRAVPSALLDHLRRLQVSTRARPCEVPR